MMKKTKKLLLNILCAVLLFSLMAFGMTGCGKTKKEDEGEMGSIVGSYDDFGGGEEEPEEDENEEERKVREKGNTLRGKSFRVEEDGSLVVFDEGMEFVWYEDASDRSINYFGGPCEVYYGEEAYDYITNDYAEDGVYKKKSVFNFSEEKLAEFFDAAEEEPIYDKDNMICMILHHEDFEVDDEHQAQLDNADELNIDTYYWGFYDGKTFLCYNIASGNLTTWIPVEVDKADKFEEDGTQEDERRDNDSKEESVGAGDSYDITVGSGSITIDIPSDAENVYTGAYSLSYDQGNINVDYSDSLCELTEDALEYLEDLYDIWKDSSDNLSNIEPTATRVGNHDAYYCRAVDDAGFACYIFLVDIGEEDYLDVTILGMEDELSEEKAFELADVKIR